MAILMIEGLPVYDAQLLDEETGMLCVSLVDRPAVESDFLSFKESPKMMQYSVEDDEKRLVWGCLMRADFPIYRRDDRYGEYYITYSAETIRKMAEKYLAESRQNEVDLNHDGVMVDGVQMVQYVIKDSSRGIVPKGFDDIADGSLFAEYHILNEDIWNQVKDGTFKGFSIEGLFNLVPTEFKKKSISNKSYMNKFKAAFKALASLMCKFGYIVTDKAIIAWEGENDLQAGDEVFIEGEDGSREPIADGEYRTEDGKVIVVVDGKVAEIRDDNAEVAPAEEEEPTAEVEAEEQTAEETPSEETPAEEETPSEEEKEDDLAKRVADLEDIVKKLTDMLGIVVIEQKKMSKTPAAPSAHEEFNKSETTSNERLDNLMRILNA